MIAVKKGFEDSEVTYNYYGQSFHVKLTEASQAELKRLKELGYEGVEEKKTSEK